MATLPRTAAPVNGRPARSRTAAKPMAGKPVITPMPPPRLIVTVHTEELNVPFVIDYPADTPNLFQKITPAQHRHVVTPAMAAAYRFMDIAVSQRNEIYHVEYDVLFARREVDGSLTWYPKDAFGECLQTNRIDELLELAEG